MSELTVEMPTREDRTANRGAVMLSAFGLALLVTTCLGAYERFCREPVVVPVVNDQRAYFYDVATDTLYISDRRIVPPVTPPFRDGPPAAARAHVFGCGGCGPQANLFIGYLEAYTAGAQAAALGKVHTAAPEKVGAVVEAGQITTNAAGTVIRRGPEGVAWFERRMERTCDGSPATPCSPRSASGRLAIAREWPGHASMGRSRPPEDAQHVRDANASGDAASHLNW